MADLQLTLGKWEVKEAREECKKYSIIERITTRTARGKHGVTYPNSRDMSIYLKPFWQCPDVEEVNRQMQEAGEPTFAERLRKALVEHYGSTAA